MLTGLLAIMKGPVSLVLQLVECRQQAGAVQALLDGHSVSTFTDPSSLPNDPEAQRNLLAELQSRAAL